MGFSLLRFTTSSGAFALTSPAFTKGGEIPEKYTCQGADLAPPLAWTAPPDGTRSLALIVDDPDAPDPAAPTRTWVHWVVYDLPPAAGQLAEGAPALPNGAAHGTSDFGETRWRGPCPPIGRHRYFFKLYALDLELGKRGPLSKSALEALMLGHMLAGVELVGTYEKVKTP